MLSGVNLDPRLLAGGLQYGESATQREEPHVSNKNLVLRPRAIADVPGFPRNHVPSQTYS